MIRRFVWMVMNPILGLSNNSWIDAVALLVFAQAYPLSSVTFEGLPKAIAPQMGLELFIPGRGNVF